jgi:molybdopterin-guanine dinucleotide biosynthesis protein A
VSRGRGFGRALGVRASLTGNQAGAHQKQTKPILGTNTHVDVLYDYTRKPLTGKSFFLRVQCYYLVMHGACGNAADGSAGFVLAGGNSKRMGNDKALLPFGGNVLIAHVAASVLEAAGSVHLVGAPERYGHLNLPTIPDLFPGFGPVGGVVTALSASGSEWNLIVACDMPGVSAEFLASLLDDAKESGAECTVPVTPDGRRHPLCAVYRRSAGEPLMRAIKAETHRLTAAIEALSVHLYPVSATDALVNVNTPTEWNTFQNAPH